MSLKNFIKNLKNNKKGQLLVEFLVVMGLAAVVIPAILTSFIVTRSGKAQHKERVLAEILLKESVEALRTLREAGWENIETNGTYHPVRSGTSWVLEEGSEVINNYTRSILIEDAYRFSNGLIAQNGGSIDPSTKKITITVSWQTPTPSSVSDIIFLTRHENLSHVTTTQQQFLAGAHTNTVVENNQGGEVVLGAGGGGDWCSPSLTIAAIDLPKNGVANAISAIEGQVIAGTGENASGVSFARVNITNTKPPSGSIVGEFSGFKTNDVFNEENYSYIATDNNFKEVVILDTRSPVSEAGYFNAPGNGNGDSVFVSGNIGFMTSGNKLYTFDLSSKSGSRPQIGSITLAGVGKSIIVVGEYVYVANSSLTNQLQIVRVTNNGATLEVVGSASLNGQNGVDLFINSQATRAYVASAFSSLQPEMFIVDISTKTGSRPVIGSYEANGMSPKAITVVPVNRAILVGTNAEEYQVINITNESAPTRCGGIDINSGVNGVASVIESDGDAYSYIITGDSTSELKIIEGGPGGQFASTGVFESDIFDAGRDVAFNRIQPSFLKPEGTDIRFQVAAADAVSGSCNNSSFQFVGPDGTGSTYYNGGGAIPFDNNGSGYENPARCAKFRVYFSTQETTLSPTLYDVIINYSP